METTAPGIYVAGDTTGSEEANTALEEGKLAGVSAAEALGVITAERADEWRAEIWERLDGLRTGPFGEKRAIAKREVIAQFPGVAKA